ncbi:MAG: methyltransferase [bacterium]|nr:methyltransferase [bacterium]
MDIIKPSFVLLKRFYKEPEKNLKLLVSRYLEDHKVESPHGVTRTVYGVIRNQVMLDAAIANYSTRKPKKIQSDVLTLLRMGVYLAVFSDSYPSYAVVNEIVGFAGKKTRGFINAVLRKCVGDKAGVLQRREEEKDPCIKYSVSPLLVKALEQIAPDPEAALEYLDREPVFHVRVNSRKFTYEEVEETLKDLQKDDEKTGRSPFRGLKEFESFQVGAAGEVVDRLLKKERSVYFQDTASQLISYISAHYAQKKVLDCCAAPGTKSMTLAALKPQLDICANDIHPVRMELVKQNCLDYGLDTITTVTSDVLDLGVGEGFDFIILDAPCTSVGTIRKNPDIKLKVTESALQVNGKRQEALLDAIVQRFPGAYILYSVCSFMKEETEDILAPVVAAGAVVEDLSEFVSRYGFKFKKGEFGIYLLPDEELNNDLFYIGLLRGRPG